MKNFDFENITDKKAKLVVGSIAQPFGYNISAITLYRSSMRRSQKQVRKGANMLKNESFLLRWKITTCY